MFSLIAMFVALFLRLAIWLICGAVKLSWWLIKNGCQLIALIVVGTVALIVKAKVAITDALTQRKIDKALEQKLVKEAKQATPVA